MKNYQYVCLIGLLVASMMMSANAAPKKSRHDKDDYDFDDSESGDRVAALFVKDGESGELRFLTGSSGGSSQINQLINQKQELLEQFRPAGSGTGVTGTGLSGISGLSGLGGLGGSSGSIQPIIVDLGAGAGTGTGTNGGNGGGGGVNQAILAGSPIADLLPQIIAQAALSSSAQRIASTNNRNRNRNRRVKIKRVRRPTGGNRNRIGNRNRQKQQQVYVLRPRN